MAMVAMVLMKMLLLLLLLLTIIMMMPMMLMMLMMMMLEDAHEMYRAGVRCILLLMLPHALSVNHPGSLLVLCRLSSAPPPRPSGAGCAIKNTEFQSCNPRPIRWPLRSPPAPVPPHHLYRHRRRQRRERQRHHPASWKTI
jgi:hypothetical protein